jgi:hypothetical protein
MDADSKRAVKLYNNSYREWLRDGPDEATATGERGKLSHAGANSRKKYYFLRDKRRFEPLLIQ